MARVVLIGEEITDGANLKTKKTFSYEMCIDTLKKKCSINKYRSGLNFNFLNFLN